MPPPAITATRCTWEPTALNNAITESSVFTIPSSQPYATLRSAGLTLTTNGAGGAYPIGNRVGGQRRRHQYGVWGLCRPINRRVVSAGSGGSASSARNVPDVALDADPNTGYSIYYSNVAE